MKQPFEDHTEKQILRTAQKTKETKPARAGRQPPNWRLMLHVYGVAVKISTFIFYFILSIYLANMGRQGILVSYIWKAGMRIAM
jgi:hypothetical protein